MEDKYICKRCNYYTYKYSDLKRHLKKKISCIKCVESFELSNDQILVLSLLPCVNNSSIVKNNEIEYLKNSNIIYDNKNILFDLLNNIDLKKIKICNYCNEKFERLQDLKKHILVKCFYKNINNNENNTNNIKDNDKLIIDFNDETNKINNSNNLAESNSANIILDNLVNSNNTINNNSFNNNNIHLHFDLKPPLPFDDDWDVSKINDKIITYILSSKHMYTELLKEILQNEINLNVILDKESKSGLVYKNDIDKYIQMKSSDIVDNTMEKLQNQLLDLNKKNNLRFEELIDFCRRMVNKKFNDFSKDKDINERVNNLMNDIFSEKKEKSIHLYNNLPKNLKENEKILNNDDGF
jgi:hypothetical protein